MATFGICHALRGSRVAARCGRLAVRRRRTGRRLPAAGRLPHPAHRPARRAGRVARLRRPARPTYRVSSILSLDTLTEGFTRPADFDLAAYRTSYVDDSRRAGTMARRSSACACCPTGLPDDAVRDLLRLGTDVEVLARPSCAIG